ncbi:MAG: hypothetical protein AAGE52_32100 [Myxococcota bacterium]
MAAKKTTKKTSTKKPAKKPAAKSARAKSKPKADAKADATTEKVAVTDKADKADKAAAKESKPKGGASALAAEILASEDASARVAEHAEMLLDSRSTTATRAARVLHELVNERTELLSPHVDKFAKGITSKHKRVVQASADALPAIAKIAPARVAKHLDTLKAAFEPTIPDGKDGLVRTFANLCTASVAYQKRLEPVLTLALEGCDGKTLQRWSQIVLPALKGEPHARARAVVEERLDRIPRSIAQQIATSLGVRLRVRYR